ncbi:flagellar assembly peptidoglycan hydrolase FlgJ [Legionella nagasakiensis]|uniref:flagellar assembly peptidoglycan hydrolase FlgJ n=1 Tax=Legionella nagasakiensis TaxID=535290 RepID=UPI001055249C|nr:flagellar assembly peptidoglycan hydrolase FlgJ [Legionella nagasakiensis]
MQDNIKLNDPGLYTNIQGLEALRHKYKNNPDMAQKEVAEQFESLLLQMLIKSMRDSNKEFASGLMSSEEGSFYEDLFDKQLALVMSKSGIGLAKNIENYLSKTQGSTQIKTEEEENLQKVIPKPFRQMMQNSQTTELTPVKSQFDSAVDFIKSLWSDAKAAAQLLNSDPRFLLAQAALETNWGKNILAHKNGRTTHNLFNIKADKSWQDNMTSLETIEQQDGVLVKETSKFRAYDSFRESFLDYVNFLKHNERYRDALKVASNPEQFAQSLQNAHYATDERYAEKIMEIFASKKFNQLIEQLGVMKYV